MQYPPRIGEAEALIAFVRRVLIFLGILAVAAFVWVAREAFLLAFLAVIVAVLLTAIAEPIDRHTAIPRRWALALAALIVFAILGVIAYFIGSEIQRQVHELINQLPNVVSELEQRFGRNITAADAAPDGVGRFAQNVLGSVAGWGLTLINGLSSLVLVAVGGAFMAANPKLYRDGIVALFPERQRARISETLDTIGRALHLWLLGQLVSMGVVGLLYGLGAWTIGLTAPLALGFFGALAEFVPVVGPLIGAVPVLLIGAGQGLGAFLWALALVATVQLLESNVISPLVARQLVQIPPALFLFAIVAFGIVFGTIGIIIAAPLTVVVYVAAKKLYVRETLGQPTEVPGEGKADAEMADQSG